MKRIPLANPILTRAMLDAAASALRNERFVLGESVTRFEEAFARYLGVDHVVTVSSGTHALQFALSAAGLKNGETVLTSPHSFVASANAVIHAGGKPEFADIDPDSYTLDPKSIRTAVERGTRFVMPVHIYGHPCDMNAISDEAAQRGAIVIEDAAQAHGAVYDGRKAGSLGTAGCFSFYPTKNLNVAGDGGAIATNDPTIANLARKVRNCGRVSQYIHDVIGYTSRLNTVNAAIGLEQLRHLDRWNEKRRALARLYEAELKDVPEVMTPPGPTHRVQPVYHLFVIQAQRRDELRTRLAKDGVETGVHYPTPIHLQPIYRAVYGYRGGEYPIAEKLAKRVLSLPMYPSLRKQEVRFVCSRIRAFYDGE